MKLSILTKLVMYQKDLIDNVSNLKGKRLISLLDCTKAFDRVGHPYLWKILQSYNLPQGLINSLKKTYESSTSNLILNGKVLSTSIPNNSGVRQGCPLAPFLFVLSLEPLLSVIRKETVGITLNGITKKINAHADDLALFSNSHEATHHN